MRSLDLHKRRRLLCLVAASGSLPNLQLLLPLMGCTLSAEVLAAAAAAGQLATCRWLHQQDCPWDMSAIQAAGKSGSLELCQWLIAAGCPGGSGAALEGAAGGGHVGLVEQLLAAHGLPEDVTSVLQAAADGCDLPTLQRWHAAWMASRDEGAAPQLPKRCHKELVQAAARSPTPDWHAKLEWLVAQGCARYRDACTSAAACAGGLERIQRLVQLGWPLDKPLAAEAAALRAGDLELLVYLDPRDAEDRAFVLQSLARRGRLPDMQALHAAGWGPDADCCMYAALDGHVHVIAWLAEVMGREAVLTADTLRHGAASGSVALLGWLRERGCEWEEDVWKSIVLSASEEALEWLAEEGCPMPTDGSPYVYAAQRGDLATLACLRRAGCPWAADTVRRALTLSAPLPALRWLADAGCPVGDWAAALAAARRPAQRGPDPRVVAWVEARCGEQEQGVQQTGQQAGQQQGP